MNPLSPYNVMKRVAGAVPQERYRNMIIVGSLAAGFHFFKKDRNRIVMTKDIDCLLSPSEEAVESGRAMAIALIGGDWSRPTEGKFCLPQSSPTPHDTLPAIRLYPPGETNYYIEFLAVPRPEEYKEKDWIPVKLPDGYFGLPCFKFLSLAAYRPCDTEFGFRYARPEMMVLGNLLSHPVIGDETMSMSFADRTIKRSNKDLGRAVALARLAGDEEVAKWPKRWEEALRKCYPGEWRELARSAGQGLRRLLESEDELDEALHSCNVGLLASQPLMPEQLRASGERLIEDAIVPLASRAENGK